MGTVILNALISNFDNVTYSLAQDNDAKFTINPVTGEVTLNNLFDFETSGNHSFTIQASVPGETPQTQTFSINISNIEVVSNFTDLNNNVLGSTTLSFSEFSNVGSVLANANTNDPNTTFSLNDPDNKFAIDANGQITLIRALDFESNESHTFQLTASLNGEG